MQPDLLEDENTPSYSEEETPIVRNLDEIASNQTVKIYLFALQILKKQRKPKLKLSEGVMIKNLRVGKGAKAKLGKMVSICYEGRLKHSKQVIDRSSSGEAVEFTLGRGEVIRGMDIGIIGMKVGAKRRIWCPSKTAYGSKGSPPSIPSNAAVVYDVELMEVV